jgi:hypothetical protein
VQQLFAAAQLPLVRVPVQRGYHRQEVLAQLRPFLAASTGSPADEPAGVMPTLGPAENSAGVAPECPKCGVPMVVKGQGVESVRASSSTAAQTTQSVGKRAPLANRSSNALQRTRMPPVRGGLRRSFTLSSPNFSRR